MRLGLRSHEQTRVLINRGEKRWAEANANQLDRYRAMMVSDLVEMTMLLREGWREKDWMAVDRALKVQERLSRLLGLDAQKEDAGPAAIHIEVSLPPEAAGETIEGEEAEVEQLPSGDEDG